MSSSTLGLLTYHFGRRRIPGLVVIQYTDRCNARCPQCGMRATETFPRSTLSPGTGRRILNAAARNRVGAISFTGGEPMLCLDEIAPLMTYAGRVGIPYIRTGTNGFFFRNPERKDFQSKVTRVAETLAATPIRNLWISIDSAIPAVHETMRGFPGVIEGIRKALPIFHAHGIYPSANLGINRNIDGAATNRLYPKDFSHDGDYLKTFYHAYRSAFKKFYRLVADLGFTMVNTCYPMSIGEDELGDGLNAVYAASAVSDVVRFSRAEKVRLFRALRHTIPEYRARLRIFSPLVSLYSLEQQYGDQGDRPYGCHGGIDFFFIDSRDGNTFPCGYRGDENLGKYWELTPHRRPRHTGCIRCDWECFRDPSELFGPILQALADPAGTLRRFLDDPLYFRIWCEDLRYYKACQMFDGRRPLHRQRLRRFQRPVSRQSDDPDNFPCKVPSEPLRA